MRLARPLRIPAALLLVTPPRRQHRRGGAAIATARWATEFSAESDAGSLLDYRVVVAALREARPDLGLDRVLTSVGRAAADQAETRCVADLSAAVADMTVPSFFNAPLASIPGFDAAVDEFMGVPDSGYDRPIFLGVGLLDRDVTLKVYPDQDHSGTVLAALPDSTPFLTRAMSSAS